MTRCGTPIASPLLTAVEGCGKFTLNKQMTLKYGSVKDGNSKLVLYASPDCANKYHLLCFLNSDGGVGFASRHSPISSREDEK